jgi:hypothetical protein
MAGVDTAINEGIGLSSVRSTERGGAGFLVRMRESPPSVGPDEMPPAHDQPFFVFVAPVPESDGTLALMTLIDARFLDCPWCGSF